MSNPLEKTHGGMLRSKEASAMLTASNQREPSRRGTTATRVWTRRLVIILTILAAIALVGVVLWGASHIIASLLIFAIAALIAYAIVPAVGLLQRVMPRGIAVLAVYLLAFIVIGLIV